MKIQKHNVFSSLRSLLQDEQLLQQLNQIHSMVTLEDMRCCALQQRSLQLEAGVHKHN